MSTHQSPKVFCTSSKMSAKTYFVSLPVEKQIEIVNKGKVKNLKSLCKLLKIKKYSKLRKQQLIDLLMSNINKQETHVEETKAEAPVEETKAEAPLVEQIVFNNTSLKNHIYSFVIQKKCYWCNQDIAGLINEYQYHAGTDRYSKMYRLYECDCKYVYNCYYFEKMMGLIRSHYYKRFLFKNDDTTDKILDYCNRFNTNLIFTDYNEIIDCLQFIIKFWKCKKTDKYQEVYDKCIEYGNTAYNLYNSRGDDDYYFHKTYKIQHYIRACIRKIVKLEIKRLEETQQLRLHFNDFYDSMYERIDECCVCYEKCLTHTKCKHMICDSCYKKIDNCPLCRREIDNSVIYTASYRKKFVNYKLLD